MGHEMEAANHEDRVTKGGGITIIKMPFSEEDLNAARLARLAEIKAECEKSVPSNTVFISDIAPIVGVENHSKLMRIAEKLNVKIYKKRKDNEYNKPANCITEEDAEKIIRYYYK